MRFTLRVVFADITKRPSRVAAAVQAHRRDAFAIRKHKRGALPLNIRLGGNYPQRLLVGKTKRPVILLCLDIYNFTTIHARCKASILILPCQACGGASALPSPSAHHGLPRLPAARPNRMICHTRSAIQRRVRPRLYIPGAVLATIRRVGG